MVKETHYRNNKVENQIINYFNRVIKNAAVNYYNQKINRKKKEFLTDSFDRIISDNYTIDSEIPNTVINGIPLHIEDDFIFNLLINLKEKESLFLVYYYFLNLSIEEIAYLFEMKVSSVYGLKRRLLEKIRQKYSL